MVGLHNCKIINPEPNCLKSDNKRGLSMITFLKRLFGFSKTPVPKKQIVMDLPKKSEIKELTTWKFFRRLEEGGKELVDTINKTKSKTPIARITINGLDNFFTFDATNTFLVLGIIKNLPEYKWSWELWDLDEKDSDNSFYHEIIEDIRFNKILDRNRNYRVVFIIEENHIDKDGLNFKLGSTIVVDIPLKTALSKTSRLDDIYGV